MLTFAIIQIECLLLCLLGPFFLAPASGLSRLLRGRPTELLLQDLLLLPENLHCVCEVLLISLKGCCQPLDRCGPSLSSSDAQCLDKPLVKFACIWLAHSLLPLCAAIADLICVLCDLLADEALDVLIATGPRDPLLCLNHDVFDCRFVPYKISIITQSVQIIN